MSVTQFSGSPSKAMRDALRQPVMVVSHHRPVAYVVSVEQWTMMVEKLRELEPDAYWDDNHTRSASCEATTLTESAASHCSV